MTLREKIQQAIDDSMKASPTNLTVYVYGPIVVPPEKIPTWAQIQRLRKALLDGADELESLINSF